MARTSKKARKSSPLNLPGAFELFTPSKEIVLKNIWIFGPIYAIPLLFGLRNWIWTPANQPSHWYQGLPVSGPGWSSTAFPDFADAAFVSFSISWMLFVLIVGTVVQIMAQKAQLDGSLGKDIHFHELWATVKKFWLRLLGLYIVVAIVTIIGFFLLIIPGFIMLRRYSLAQYVMLDKNVGIREAMDTSADMSKPYSHTIYSIIGVMILIGLISIIPFIGWLISYALGMLYSVAFALRYQQLKKLA
ncbi:hypothetical protein KW803_00050 [Candidatus Saccharibacteria bacterium]|nr:hypothetical protein [Candidatus Saccharibacteria bacterium]